LALKADGTVAAWGDDDAASQVPDGLSNVVAISCKDYNVALKSDGSIVAWGRNSRSESAVFSGLSGVVAVSAQFVVKSDGTIGAWSFQARGLLLLGQEFRMWPSSPRVEVISLL
jgi:alpha-tubulin suppressor-like RCC1 family protein